MLNQTYKVLAESFDEVKGIVYGSLDSGKTISFEGTKACIGEFLNIKVTQVRKSVIYGEIVDKDQVSTFKEKNFKNPIEVSILPKDQKNLKILRQNKKSKKEENDNKSKK